MIAEITEYVKYANANLQATALVPPEIRDNPVVYPPPEIRSHLFTDEVTPPKIDRVMNRVWTSVKTGS